MMSLRLIASRVSRQPFARCLMTSAGVNTSTQVPHNAPTTTASNDSMFTTTTTTTTTDCSDLSYKRFNLNLGGQADLHAQPWVEDDCEEIARGTLDHPILVNSMRGQRLVGCICDPDDSSSVTWISLKKGSVSSCKNCGNCFKIQEGNP